MLKYAKTFLSIALAGFVGGSIFSSVEAQGQYYQPVRNGNSYYSQPVSNAWAQSLFPNKKHNFGTVARAAKAEHSFWFTNKTTEPIELLSVRVSCRCTSPEIVTKVVQPGEKGQIIAKFQTRTFVGQRGASMTVSMKKGNTYASTILRVDGYIRRDIVVHPASVHLPKVIAADGGSTKVKVLYAGRSDWKITSASCGNKALKINLTETRRSNGRVEYELETFVAKEQAVGQIVDVITLHTNDRTLKSFPVSVSANIVQPIRMKPEIEFTVRDGVVACENLMLASTTAFTVTDYECSSCPVEIELSGNSRRVHRFKISTKGLKEGRSEHTLVLKTNHPNQPQAIVRLVVNVLAAK